MILGTGDLHRQIDLYRLSSLNFPFGKKLTKKDYLIIAGDFGLVWDASEGELRLRKWLEDKPWTTLFVDGNHENFDLLDKYPISEMFGGEVSIISPSIIWLRRGQIFEIDYTKIFTFGGAFSIDIYTRLPGRSWWPQEIPNQTEYNTAIKNLEKNNWEVDYVITHTCPYHEVDSFTYMYIDNKVKIDKKEDRATYMLQDIKDKLKFKKWYFGHFHVNKEIGRFHCLYYDIVQLGGKSVITLIK